MSLVDTSTTPSLLGHSPELTTTANNQASTKDISLLALGGFDQNVLMAKNSTSTNTNTNTIIKPFDSLTVKPQQTDIIDPQLHHHHYHHHHYHHHHHLIQSSTSKTASSHRENTSFITGTNQETDSVAAYTYTPISSPPTSPLITPTDLGSTIMSDDIIATSTTRQDINIIGGDKEDNTNALMESKKKSIRSRFKEVLKKSNLSSKTSGGGGGGVGTGNNKNRSPTFTFLPSSSSPIPNTSQSQCQRQRQTQQHQQQQQQHQLVDIGKRHSTSSTLLKKSRQLQEKHDTKACSWQPPLPSSSASSPILSKDTQQQWTTNTNANLYHQYHHYHVHHIEPATPPSNSAISPLFLASPLIEKDNNNCSPSSSTSSLTTPSPLTPSDTTAIGDSNTTMKEDNGIQMPFSPSLSPTPFATSSTTTSMPPSRFLTAFQKLRQQKPTMDPTINTTSGSMTSPTTHTAPRLSLDAISVTPSPSVAAAATTSKSTSFAEKIKTRFQSNTTNKLDQRPSSRLPTPVMSKSVAPTGKAIKNSKKPTTPTYRSELKSQSPPSLSASSAASPMAQSWSHFSRTFVPSCSVQHASSRYSPKKSKQDKVISSSPPQNRPNMGKAQRMIIQSPNRSTSQPIHATNRRSLQRKQHEQQQTIKTTGNSTKQHQAGQKNTLAVISTPQIETRDDNSTTTTNAASNYNHPFDANAQVIQGNMIISPTCSTSSHHSSSTTLSVAVSTSSISTSESPSIISDPLNTNSNMEIKSCTHDLLTNANKSASSLSATSTATCTSSSDLSFSSAQSSPIESTTTTTNIITSKSSLAPVILSSPTPTATKTNTSTNPSAILTLKNKPSNAPSRLTLKSPKRNLTELTGIKNNKTNNHKIGTKSLGTDTNIASTITTTTKQQQQQSLTKKKKLRVRFISTAKVQDTFSKHDYDRASDPYAVCTHLTAHLAQQIKEELNTFKLEEMKVHDLSRGNTQFFL